MEHHFCLPVCHILFYWTNYFRCLCPLPMAMPKFAHVDFVRATPKYVSVSLFLCRRFCAVSVSMFLCRRFRAVSVSTALCIMLYALRFMHYALCQQLYALCQLLYALCQLLYALCQLLYALCHQLNALWHQLCSTTYRATVVSINCSVSSATKFSCCCSQSDMIVTFIQDMCRKNSDHSLSFG